MELKAGKVKVSRGYKLRRKGREGRPVSIGRVVDSSIYCNVFLDSILYEDYSDNFDSFYQFPRLL